MPNVDIEWDHDAFSYMEERGVFNDYITNKSGKFAPLVGKDALTEDRWFAIKGEVITFLNRNGYPSDLERAQKVLFEGQRYIVASVRIGGSSSRYKLEGVNGEFNTVMFERIRDGF